MNARRIAPIIPLAAQMKPASAIAPATEAGVPACWIAPSTLVESVDRQLSSAHEPGDDAIVRGIGQDEIEDGQQHGEKGDEREEHVVGDRGSALAASALHVRGSGSVRRPQQAAGDHGPLVTTPWGSARSAYRTTVRAR